MQNNMFNRFWEKSIIVFFFAHVNIFQLTSLKLEKSADISEVITVLNIYLFVFENHSFILVHMLSLYFKSLCTSILLLKLRNIACVSFI